MRALEAVEFDIRGQICPSTLLTALRELNAHQEALQQGRVALRFRTDNRDCLTTIPESAQNMGYRVEVARDGADYVIEIRRGV